MLMIQSRVRLLMVVLINDYMKSILEIPRFHRI